MLQATCVELAPGRSSNRGLNAYAERTTTESQLVNDNYKGLSPQQKYPVLQDIVPPSFQVFAPNKEDQVCSSFQQRDNRFPLSNH